VKPNEHKDVKGWLVAAALLFGIVVAFMAAAVLAVIHPLLSLLGPIIGIVAALLYVTLAATAVNWILGMRGWAYCDKIERPKDKDVLSLAAVWLLALFPAALLYLFIGIINRTFDERT
jgi:hypothetical protein